ncbi:MAG: thiamine phosphate synthase [Actinobacteria bacterium]|nr:thiamine phosphate synthase [Actinomycetota bacterium]
MNGRRRAGWLELMRLVIITSGGSGNHADIAAAALEAGCRSIQLRDKSLDDRSYASIAREIKEMCDSRDALFFVNDRVDIALIVGSSGIHLGVDDISVKDARDVLPGDAIIGYSPETRKDAAEAVKLGADYLGIGPVCKSPTKSDAGEPIGVAGVSEYCRARLAPVIAVGGIDRDTVTDVMKTGAAGVAVSSAVSGSVDPLESAVLLLKAIGGKPEDTGC